MTFVSRGFSEISSLLTHLHDHRRMVIYRVIFFGGVGLLSAFVPELLPIIVAAALVHPIRFLLTAAVSPLDESDWSRFSPLLATITEFRLFAVVLMFSAVPVGSWFLGLDLTWDRFGSFVHLVAGTSVVVLAWSEAIYQRNFYFDRFHLVERLVLVIAAGLAVLMPVFLPLFLLARKLILDQFNYPRVGGFNTTHSHLPLTTLLVVSSFVVIDLGFDVRPNMVIFLLFCGYAAHYFHPGIAKLKNGPVYYIRHNNPVNMFLASYEVGWVSFISENTAIGVGKLSEKVKPILNLYVVLVEISVVLMLISHEVALAIVSLVISLHLFIFLSSGDNFWKWMTVNLSVLVGLLLFVDPAVSLFMDTQWVALVTLFAAAARLWMNPVGMDWLDSPYSEHFEFKADLSDGRTVTLHPNVFRPYDIMTAQGVTGRFTFLGTNPRITYCHGAMIFDNRKQVHEIVRDSVLKESLDGETAQNLVENCGVYLYDKEQTNDLEELLEQFLQDDQTATRRLLRYVSSPREFYTVGLSDGKSHRLRPNIEVIRVYRTDGIWTNDGFYELHRSEVASTRADSKMVRV